MIFNQALKLTNYEGKENKAECRKAAGLHWQTAHVFGTLLSNSGMNGREKQVQKENHKQTLARGCVSFYYTHVSCTVEDDPQSQPHYHIDSSVGQSPTSKYPCYLYRVTMSFV